MQPRLVNVSQRRNFVADLRQARACSGCAGLGAGAPVWVACSLLRCRCAAAAPVAAALTKPFRLAASVAHCLIGHTPLANPAPLSLSASQVRRLPAGCVAVGVSWGCCTQCLRCCTRLAGVQEEQLEALRFRIATPFEISCQEHQVRASHLPAPTLLPA